MVAASGACRAAANVLISEIHYHAANHLPTDEFLEIHNAGDAAQDLTGWTIQGGVDFAFPPVTLAAGARLVVPADSARFATVYPGVTNVTAAYTGNLGNSGNRLRLFNALGAEVDEVEYSDEGDWAYRTQGPLDNGHRGWEWTTPADGGGSSLELVNPMLPGNNGQNWLPSITANGTPGAPNSRASGNVAPLILDAQHWPIMPAAGREVFVNAAIRDESLTNLVVEVLWRVDGAGTFQPVTMVDDGLHNDGPAGDRTYGARIPGQAENTVVEWYVRATDGSGLSRTWPAPVLSSGLQEANALYQHKTLAAYSGSTIEMYLVMRAAEWSELDALGNATPDANSDAQFNATFISRTVDGLQLRYRCGVRNRGNGSRTYNPNNRRVNFPRDYLWEDREGLNLNARNVNSQIAGNYLSSFARVPGEPGQLVRLFENGVNYARAGDRMWGYYAWIDPVDATWAERLLPNNDGGNVYSAQRAISGTAVTDLTYLGTNPTAYANAGYAKNTNERENNWTDLINLTFALRPSQNDSAFWAAIQPHVNVDEWVRYFAFLNLIGYDETALGTGSADDYAMYRGTTDPRFLLMPHDHDADFGINNNDQWTAASINTLANQGIFRATSLAVPAKFLRHPEVAPRYYAVLLEYTGGFFSAAELPRRLDECLGGRIPQATINTMLSFASARRTSIAAQIPLDLTAVSALPVVNGFPTTTAALATVTGRAHAVQTRFVRVNGATASWTPAGAHWARVDAPLQPGLNRFRVESVDAAGAVFDTADVAVFRQAGVTNALPVAITNTVTLTAAGGPHRLTGATTVTAAGCLVVQPGATVLFDAGASLTVNGCLQADGTANSRITFMRTPGQAGDWNGLELVTPAGVTNVLRNVDFIECGGGAHAVGATSSHLVVESCTFSGTDRTVLELDNASALIRGNTFPSVAGNGASEVIHGNGILAGGRMIIDGNTFGTVTGYNDVIDFTGGQRPGPIIQILNNHFTGGSDDGLDLDGTDAHIEGNLFENFRKNNTSDSSSNAIATGVDGGSASEVTVARNVFRACDHAILLKEGSSAVFQNNTVVGSLIAAIQCDEPNRPVDPGLGIAIESCIFHDNARLFINTYTNHPTEGTTLIALDRSIVPAAHAALGQGNLDADPLFENEESGDFRLREGSPAARSGRAGIDRGALVPPWITAAGPPAENDLSDVEIEVHGPGLDAYVWSLNGGPWSAVTPIGAPLALSAVPFGCHVVDLLGRNSAGVWQTEPVSVFWCRQPADPGLRISEVLAWNTGAFPDGGTFPDYVELINPGDSALDLGGFSITDDPLQPRRFVFPGGTLVPARGFLVVRMDASPGAGVRTGFALESAGGSVAVYSPQTNLVHSVDYGLQIPDHSIGLDDVFAWELNVPTPGANNIAAPVAAADRLSINEWLPNADALFGDFVELFNPDPVAVNLSGCLLTDAPSSWPDRHRVPGLSFIAPSGFTAVAADGSEGPGRLPFALNSVSGEIALFSPATNLIDYVYYTPIAGGSSRGRQPDGSETLVNFSTPTPGLPNPVAVTVAGTSFTTNTLVAFSSPWRYLQNGSDPGANFAAPAYNDSAWPQGQAMFYNDVDALPLPKVTQLQAGRTSYYFRTTFAWNGNTSATLFRLRHVIDDGCAVWLNGQEVTSARHGMPAPPWTFRTVSTVSGGDAALRGPFTVPASLLQTGVNTLAVEVHNNSFFTDMAFAVELTAVTTNLQGYVVINEVHASGEPDWVELANPGQAPFDLSGYQLSDDPLLPGKHVVPGGTVLPAGGYLRLYLNASAPSSATNAPFGLDNDGESLRLHLPAAQGGGVIQAVTFGPQVPGFSLGRVPNASGAFALNVPTPLAANTAQPLGSPSALRFNEWMASPALGDDWFELHNPGALPVQLSGLSLTDNLNDRDQHVIPPLSFIGGGAAGWIKLLADNQPAKGGQHVAFRLSATGETLGLYDTDLVQIDTIAFGPQSGNISEGRLPDGGPNVLPFPSTATPGAANFSVDSDLDGMPNTWETTHSFDMFTNDADGDADGDGLSNLNEFLRGTLPRDPDSDDDGLPDGWETTNGFDPLVVDASTDGDLDGLSASQEYQRGTSPALFDSDGDQISDGWEVRNATGPTVSNGGADPDGDGVDNFTEFVSGTDPNDDGLSGLQLFVGRAGQNPVSILQTTATSSEAGFGNRRRYYTLEAAPALPAAVWTPLPGYANILGNGQAVVVTDSSTNRTRVVRARIWLEP